MFYRVYTNLTNIITWLVILLAIGAVALLGLPRIVGITPYVVMSGSMEPEIHTGSLAYIGHLEEDPEKGDIIGFVAADGKPVVHRVAAVTDNGYQTKGDANNAPDGVITERQNILGPYLFSIPYAGYAAAVLGSVKMNFGPVQVPAAIPAAAGLVMILTVIQCFLKPPGEEDEDK